MNYQQINEFKNKISLNINFLKINAATPGFAQTQGSFLSWNGEIRDEVKY